MRVLQVNGYQSPGRRFNGLSLKPYLAELDIQSKYFVWEKDKQELDVIGLDGKWTHRLNRGIRGLEKALSIQSLLYPHSLQLAKLPEFQEADVVHYHIIHSRYFSILSLPHLTHLKPTVWTLHDPWAMTGHCIHPFDCERWRIGCGECPALDIDFKINFDTTALAFKLKNFAYSRSKLELIVASSWMEERVRQSPLLSRFPVHRVPFGLDLDYFRPGDSVEAKRRLGIDSQRLVICFRSVDNDFKGLQYVMGALDKLDLDIPICLLTLNDKGRIDRFRDRFQIVELGWTNDDALLRDAFDATDVFLMPSLAEAFGLMAIEAMASGKPTICFEGTALPEVIFAPDAGVAVAKRDATALAEAIIRLATNPEERIQRGMRSRQLAEKYYDIHDQARHVADIYRNVLSN